MPLHESGGSILLAILLHASGNTWGEPLDMGSGTADGAGLTKILAVAVAALAAVWITRRGHPGLGFAGHPQLPSTWFDSTTAKETSDAYRHVHQRTGLVERTSVAGPTSPTNACWPLPPTPLRSHP